MPRLPMILALMASAELTAACATVVLAPGAAQIRLTHNVADVAACAAVGNVAVPKNAHGLVDGASAETEFRNQTVGLGGNVGFVTGGALGVPAEGVAYRCP